MDYKKTAVFISGQHLQAAGWDDVMWGSPETGRYGRVARGVAEAKRWDADLIVFGTGSSERDGVVEAEVIFNIAQERIGSLPEFTALPDAAAWLSARAYLETTSQNTKEEVLAGSEQALVRGIERIVLVSSPTHILRVHKIALSLFSADSRFARYTHELYAVASDVPYEGYTVDDVVIIEPPHRGDRPHIPFHATAKHIFEFQKNAAVAEGFNDAWKKLIDVWKNKLP